MIKILHIGLCVYKGKESSLTRAFKNHCNQYVELDLEKVNHRAELIARIFKPDIVFFQIQAENVVQLSTVKAVKEHSKFVVNWTGDIRTPTPAWFIPFGKEIDCTLFTNMQDVKYLRKCGCNSEFLQIGYDETIYYPSKQKKDIDIVFMGNNYTTQFPLSGLRFEMVKRLKKRYGNKFHVFGTNWGKYGSGNVNHSQEEEAKIYRRSRLGINLSHFDVSRYTSDRMLRLMGCGVPCLTHKFKDIHQDFPEDTVITWTTLRELEKKIDYYLENETDAGIKGEELVRNNWTFDCMVKALIKLYESNCVLPVAVREGVS